MVPEVSPPPKTATPEVLQRIQEVIKQTATPSWLNSVPKNFGEAKAGTLKAAEWHTLATVYIPIAVVVLWGEGSTHPSPEIAKEFRTILDHSMALISAVCLICYLSLSDIRTVAYDDYLSTYIRDLKQIHPSAKHRSNHHMGIMSMTSSPSLALSDPGGPFHSSALLGNLNGCRRIISSVCLVLVIVKHHN